MMLPHTVIIERATVGAVDDYNQPSQTFTALAVVPAFVQPKPSRELALLNEGGPVRGRYRIFTQYMGLRESDHLIYGAEVYEIVGQANAAGMDHHWQLDAERVWP